MWHKVFHCIFVAQNSTLMEHDETLRIRVSTEVKNQLQALADKDKRKLSDYLRLQLIKLIEDTKTK